MDFLDFYNLKEQPFSSSIDNRFYFDSAQHSDALVRLKYSVDTQKGLAVVVGDVGTGKTTLARRMLDELDEDRYEAALLIVLHTSVTSDWLMKKISLQLGVENVGDNKLDILTELYKKLVEIQESGLKTVVLMDEVQMLESREIMEEFRGLLNMEGPKGSLLTLILFGLPELETILAWDIPLKQRIAMKYKMIGFDEQITGQYIQHRLTVAGCEGNIFTPDAVRDIHRYSQGVPRLVNTLCDNAILEGFLMKAPKIDNTIIELVAVNLDLKLPDAGSAPETSSGPEGQSYPE